MIEINVIIGLVFIMLFLAVIFLFIVENKKMQLHHKKTLIGMKKAITIQHGQMNFRNDNLQKYNFLKYNLKEALVVQKEIKIY